MSGLLVPNRVLHQPGMIGIPCGEQGRWTDFARSLIVLERPARSRLTFVYGTYIQAQRNDLVEEMLANPECEWLFMVDDDHTFDRSLLIRLLDHQVDVVGALAIARKPPYFICAFDEIDTRGGKSRGVPFHGVKFEMQRVAAVGTGAILIRRHVLEAIEPPWFEVRFDDQGKNVSEDATFCEKVANAGFEVWLDGTQSIGHLTGVALSLEPNGIKIQLSPDDAIVIPMEQIDEVVPGTDA